MPPFMTVKTNSKLELRPRTGTCLQWPDNHILRTTHLDKTTIDPAAMGRVAKALAFICGADHPTTLALKVAAESQSERDVKKARLLFLQLKPGDRKAVLAMISD